MLKRIVFPAFAVTATLLLTSCTSSNPASDNSNSTEANAEDVLAQFEQAFTDGEEDTVIELLHSESSIPDMKILFPVNHAVPAGLEVRREATGENRGDYKVIAPTITVEHSIFLDAEVTILHQDGDDGEEVDNDDNNYIAFPGTYFVEVKSDAGLFAAFEAEEVIEPHATKVNFLEEVFPNPGPELTEKAVNEIKDTYRAATGTPEGQFPYNTTSYVRQASENLIFSDSTTGKAVFTYNNDDDVWVFIPKL